MPTLTIKLEEEETHVPFRPGRSLLHILSNADVRVRAGCNETGACGLCTVQILAGKVNEPTPNELLNLKNSQLTQGVRLACQVVPEEDLQIAVLAQATRSTWKSLDGEAKSHNNVASAFSSYRLLSNDNRPYGVAIDLGTSHIKLSLYDLFNGQWVTGRYGLNPQENAGSDIMTRLVAAVESPRQAEEMSQQIMEAIGEALWDMAIKEGFKLNQVIRLVLVGNTAMLALMSGRSYDLLLQPGYWIRAIDCLPHDPESWAVTWGLHHEAKLEVIPPLAGFVGSDLLAGLLAIQMDANAHRSLFIDFGTNSEIALWDGETLWVTSAAGGPAFEGSGISCGLPAEPGAIYQVGIKSDELKYTVIGNIEPQGLCGSGLVDLIAGLVRTGKLNNRGLFESIVPNEGFTLVQNEQNIVLTKKDVDVFQRAKAAIGAGLEILLAKSGMKLEDLRCLYIGGAFGRYLNIANAQQIGLLPNIQHSLVELCGNTALAGSEEILLLPAAAQRLQKIKKRSRIINMSQCPDFENLFLHNLYLQPLGVYK